MSKILIIGASLLQLPAILKARELGYHTVVADYDPHAVGIGYADEYFNVSTIDAEGITALAEKIRPDGIITLATDMPMRALASATTRLGLPGISLATAVLATDKGKQIEMFEKSGVAHPRYVVLHPGDNPRSIEGKMVFPCVVKPTDNAGNRGVSFCRDVQELADCYSYSLSNSRSGDVIVEEYMEGSEVSVEIIVYHGKVHVLAVTDKMTLGKPYFVEIGHTEQSRLAPADVAAINGLASRAVLSLGIDDSAAHVEIMLTKDGPRMVELGARMGGGCITTHLVPLSTGIDMIKSVMDMSMGLTPDVTPKFDKGSALRHITGVEGTIVRFEGVEEAKSVPGVKEVAFMKKEGEEARSFRNGSDRIGYVIAQGEDASDAERICQEALSRIKVVTV
ncbi:MAG: ATP-grasp domain-containing protein [Bacteroidales bacterium]|nr:ATP-grasp domain-containing protein [Bacteroidales bacterium]